jgi:pimeloyl-ACP methyl ester carboxylesterase
MTHDRTPPAPRAMPGQPRPAPHGLLGMGRPANPRVLVCVHGLSRQGRDFDTLARDLRTDYRVVCPDVVGRGRSDWLADPMGYSIPAYVADMVTLLARLDAEQVDWVGTSMGGLIGLGLAACRARRCAAWCSTTWAR